MKILVTHPGRQHVHQLVRALKQRNMLLQLFTGIPSAATTGEYPFYQLIAGFSPQPVLDLPLDHVRHFYVPPLIRRLAKLLASPSKVVEWGHTADHWFDKWCSSGLDGLQADAVICYENSALHTFHAAKERGWTTILDAASFHHAWQDRHFDYPESETAHKRITERKDREIELADHILTVSELARESYIEAGVSPDRITSIPVGCDLEQFQSRELSSVQENAPCTFLFAGHASARKGVDTLLGAAAQLEEREVPFRLWFAGGTEESLPWDRVPSAERLGYLDQEVLAQRMHAADCLVLPSRHDSFGMVVVEAMAAGCPVIVSDQVGAKQAVTEGESGWVVPAEDADALADRMQWCIDHVDTVRSMADAAREDASAYSWQAYRERVAQHLQSLLLSA
jgi:glycosyltransferase involved in cell wall biosynthesis